MSDEAGNMARFDAETLAGIAARLMHAAGVDQAQTASVSDNLIWNDAAGRHNHGFERLPAMLARVAAGGIAARADMRFRSLAPSLAHLDAGGGFGQHAGRLAIDRAVDLARAQGVGIVGVSNSHFFGTGAYFVARAAAAGMISFAFSNSFAKVAAHGGSQPVLGTNPLAFAAPRGKGDPLIVDFSTASMAGSTRRAGGDLPEGAVAEDTGALLPAAGAKGFGLALMVEVLAGVLTGAGIGREVGSLYTDGAGPAQSGHFFMVIDPQTWLDPEAFVARMETMVAMVMESGPPGAVRLPGTTRAQALRDSAAQGVGLTGATIAALDRLATGYGVAPLPEPRRRD
jgi:LDH2 family malate/lactate/ureidoglycolate dehydrogenase